MLNPKKKSSNVQPDLAEKEKKEKEEAKKVEAAKVDEEFWSEDQQKSLENALKKYPNSIPANERWAKIAQDVPGKTKKQCVDRFKHIAQLIKNKNSATSSDK